MQANQVRTIIISLPDLADIQAALDKLRSGKALTIGDSGVAAYGAIGTVEVALPWQMTFDGFNYTVFVFVTSG